jgi:hypothetical protein
MRAYAALLVLTGCGLGFPDAHWSDQLSPEGACWELNLADGIDESSTDEIHALFACLNRTGNLEAFSEVDQVMDVRTRSDRALGRTVAELMNRLPKSGYDLFGLAGKILQVIDKDHFDARLAMEMLVEALYARPYPEVAATVDLRSQAELDRGVIRPGIPLVATVAQTVLDNGEAIPDLAVSMLESDRLDDAACTLAGLFESQDPAVSAIGAHLLPRLGDALERIANSENDLWLDASGNSLRDFITVMLLESGADGQTAIEALSGDLKSLMSDARIQSRTRSAIAVADSRGDVARLPEQLLYLASVDVWGDPLLRGSANPSALHVGLRMLHRGDVEVVCTIPIIGVGINLGNLSETIIRILAESNLTEVEDAVALLTLVLNEDITRSIAEEIAEGGYCDPIDTAFLADLTILERLQDEEITAMVPMLVDLLDVVYSEGEIDRIPELVDLLSGMYQRDLIEPFSELLRDTADAPLTADLTTIIGVMIDPDELMVDACPADSAPLDFDAVWAIALDGLNTTGTSDSPIEVLTPLLEATVDHSATWATIANLSALAQEDTARIQQLPQLYVDGLTLTEGSNPAAFIADLLDDPALRDRALEVLESGDLRDAIMAAEPDTEGPLPFVARLVTSEAVTVMLQTIDLLLDTLGESDGDSAAAD